MSPLVLATAALDRITGWCETRAVPTILKTADDTYFLSILGPCTAHHGPDHGKAVSDLVPLPGTSRHPRLDRARGGCGHAACAPRDRVEVSPRRCSYSHSPRSRPRPTAIAQTFHPQDLMSVGPHLRRNGSSVAATMGGCRCGVRGGVSLQAVRPSFPRCLAVLGAAPGWRARARVAVPVVGVVALGVVPSTWRPRSTRCGP